MAKNVPKARIRTYGIYTQWDSTEKSLPECTKIATQIPAVVDIEFGMTVNVRGGKNVPLVFRIDHPGIMDDKGIRRPPFTGTVHAKTNDWDFFLGDTIWLPLKDKIGPWKLTLEWNQTELVSQILDVYAPPDIMQGH